MKKFYLFKEQKQDVNLSKDSTPELLYEQLRSVVYSRYPFDTTDLEEGMSVVNEVIMQYWKPRFLIDHEAKCAYEFMDNNEYFRTITSDDIAWDTLTNISEEIFERVKRLSAHYPTFIRKYQNGVAEVSWQINPDGQYFMDEDGFGMTDDKEIEIYGFIDRRGKVLVKFQMIRTSDDLKRMRKEAEELIL